MTDGKVRAADAALPDRNAAVARIAAPVPAGASRTAILRWLFAAFCATAACTSASHAADNRTLDLYNTHTKERLTITFKKNGKYVASSLKELNRFLRDWRRNEPTNMDPRLFDTVWEVYTRSGSRQPIHVVSAYRSLATNNMLRSKSSAVAKHSQHTLGKAMDMFLPDVKVAKLREIGMSLQRGGVGFYPTANTPFVHIDVGSVRAWPRMSRQQLVKIFPDGKTLHIPADGKPLAGYQQALAELKRNGGVRPLAISDDESSGKKKGGLLAMLFGDEEDETQELEAATSRGGQVVTSTPEPDNEPATPPPATVVAKAPPAPAPAPAPAPTPTVELVQQAIVASAPPPPPVKPQELLAMAAASAARAAEETVTVAAIDPSIRPRRRPEMAVADEAPVQVAAAPLPLPTPSDEPADAQMALAEVARASSEGAAPAAALGYASATAAQPHGQPRVASLTRSTAPQNRFAAAAKAPKPPVRFGEKSDPLVAFKKIEPSTDLPIFDASQTTYRGDFAKLAHPNQRSSEFAFTTPTMIVKVEFDKRAYGDMTSVAFSGVSLSRVPVVRFEAPRDLAMR